jgi:uncharacterized protein (DUF2237 family)
MDESINVWGQPLIPCSNQPLTGFYRNGCCDTSEEDHGCHTVCAVTSEDFLEFSKQAGNDLSTPRPQWNFPGVNPGEKWCLCASRWLEAYRYGKAPKVDLNATHKKTLEIIPLEILERFDISETT